MGKYNRGYGEMEQWANDEWKEDCDIYYYKRERTKKVEYDNLTCIEMKKNMISI